MEDTSIIPIEKVERSILYIRGQKVMLDCDLAEIYGIKTKRLNEQVKRNIDRFPDDFMFQLTNIEKEEVVANCDHLTKIKFSNTYPYAFTEHGAIMLAGILNTPNAINTSIIIVRAFIKIRQLLSTHKDLIKKLTELESKYDKQFNVVFQAIRQLMSPELDKNRTKIGYKLRSNK